MKTSAVILKKPPFWGGYFRFFVVAPLAFQGRKKSLNLKSLGENVISSDDGTYFRNDEHDHHIYGSCVQEWIYNENSQYDIR